MRLTNNFKSDVSISKGELAINAKSILGILSLAASLGVEIEIETKGDDEEFAMSEVISLFDSKFGEES